MVRPGEYLEPLMLLAGSLLVAALDVLVFVVLLDGSMSAIGCFAFGSAGGAGWLIEVWRRRREAVAQLEEWTGRDFSRNTLRNMSSGTVDPESDDPADPGVEDELQDLLGRVDDSRAKNETNTGEPDSSCGGKLPPDHPDADVFDDLDL